MEELREKLTKAGYELVKERFAWDKVAKAVEDRFQRGIRYE